MNGSELTGKRTQARPAGVVQLRRQAEEEMQLAGEAACVMQLGWHRASSQAGKLQAAI